MYVELKNINKTFGDYKASDNVNFGIEKGKLIGLLGPSGSGKTTILRMIAGLENPDSGEIVIDGKVVNDIPASKRGIGFVFQNYALFPHMKIFDNVAYGLRIRKESNDVIAKKVKEALAMVGLEKAEHRYPNQLSGGEQQMLAMGRALMSKPRIILMDEPSMGLSPIMVNEIFDIIRAVSESGTTVLLVEQNAKKALSIADRAYVLETGKIVLSGDAKELLEDDSIKKAYLGE